MIQNNLFVSFLRTPSASRQELILPPREAQRQATRGEPQDRRGPVQDRRCFWLSFLVRGGCQVL